MTEMIMKWLPVLLICTGILLGVPAAMGASPQLPCEFYGTILLSGAPAPVGTMITAMVNNTPQGTIIVNNSGYYGGTGTFDERLIVMAGENDFANGVPLISFSVNGMKAVESVPYQPGTSMELNLTFGASPVPVASAPQPVNSNPSGQSASPVVPTESQIQPNITPSSSSSCIINQVS